MTLEASVSCVSWLPAERPAEGSCLAPYWPTCSSQLVRHPTRATSMRPSWVGCLWITRQRETTNCSTVRNRNASVLSAHKTRVVADDRWPLADRVDLA